MKQWAAWVTAVLAIVTLVATNTSNISKILGIAATKSQSEVEQERLEVFARKSVILYAGYDKITAELGLVYFIESHPCVDYEISYSIHNTIIDQSSRPKSVCEDMPEVVSGTYTVRALSVDPGLIRPHFYTINGELIRSNDVNVLIRWKFKFSDGSFGYHTMTAAIPIEDEQ